jgi:hypothetical protein
MTRKRKRAQRANSLEFLLHFCIVESTARFLNFRDCANVDQLSRNYHSKLWLNVLRCSSRSWVEIIPVLKNSQVWLYKFAGELRHQTLQLSPLNEHIWINISARITKLHSLRGFYIDYPIVTPLYLHKLFVWKCTSLIQLRNLNILEVGYACNSMQSLPATVSKLKLYYPDQKWLESCPIMPHVTTVNYHYRYYLQLSLASFLSKFPAMETLKLVYPDDHVCNLELLRTCQSLRKLSIHYVDDLDLSDLKDVALLELDVSNCPKVLDFSHVRHIPIVHKYQQ